MRTQLGKLLVLLAFLALFFLTHPRPKYELAVGAIFRNEARFLSEWIEYHRLVGVEHFYLYNNLSEDGYREVLEPYLREGIVELFEWPYDSTSQKEWNPIQCLAYNDLIEKKGRETKWLAIIDTDEFILPMVGDKIPPLLKEHESRGGLAINWQLFGTSNVQKIPEQATLIGTLTKKAPPDFEGNRFVKTIFQPKRVETMKKPHHCKYKKPFFHVTETGRPFRKKSVTDSISIDKIRINHYTYRDGEFFEKEKRKRILQWFPEKRAEPNPDFSLLEDTAILRFVLPLERALFLKEKAL